MKNTVIQFLLWWAYALLFLCILAIVLFTIWLLILTFIHQAWPFLVLVPLVCVPTTIVLLFGMSQLHKYIRFGNWMLRKK